MSSTRLLSMLRLLSNEHTSTGNAMEPPLSDEATHIQALTSDEQSFSIRSLKTFKTTRNRSKSLSFTRFPVRIRRKIHATVPFHVLQCDPSYELRNMHGAMMALYGVTRTTLIRIPHYRALSVTSPWNLQIRVSWVRKPWAAKRTGDARGSFW